MIEEEGRIPTLAKRLIVIVAGLLIAGLVLRNAVVLIGNQSRAPLGLSDRIWPADGTLELIDRQLIVPQIDWTKHSVPYVAQAARRARALDPLDEWPFALKGMIDIKSGDYRSATRALEQARRRNSRAPTPHLLLLTSYANLGMIDETLNQLVTFVNLRPELTQPLMPLLAAAVLQDQSGELLTKLDRYPRVLAQLIEAASLAEGSDILLPRLLERPSVTRAMKLESISVLASRDRHALAYPLWQALQDKSASLPYDRDFQGLEGPEPYVWTLTSGSNVVVDFSKQTAEGDIALDVEAFGSTSSRVAEQTMKIPAGKHVLSISGKAIDPQAETGVMRWTLSCVGSAKAMGQAQFEMVEGGQRRQLDFVVPDRACAFQTLALEAIPGETRGAYRMRFDQIRLDGNAR